MLWLIISGMRIFTTISNVLKISVKCYFQATFNNHPAVKILKYIPWQNNYLLARHFHIANLNNPLLNMPPVYYQVVR